MGHFPEKGVISFGTVLLSSKTLFLFEEKLFTLGLSGLYKISRMTISDLVLKKFMK